MKTTDYSHIAARYDNNKLRHDIPRDEYIEQLYKHHSKGFTILDLACGTGNWLKKQIKEFHEHDITWIGIDKSPEMLAVAESKKLKAELFEGDACNVPLPDNSVDYIKIRFAFHHFENKKAAVREVHRILKKEGAVNIFNICRNYMKHSWVYRYFPDTEKIDHERFPDPTEIFAWFDQIGFDTSITIRTVIKKYYFRDIIEETINRDMSQLTLISDEKYSKGLSKMRKEARKSEYIIGDFSFFDLYAKKK